MKRERPLLPTAYELRNLQWTKEVCDKHHNLHLLAGALVPEVETCAVRGDAAEGKPLYVNRLLWMAVEDRLWRKARTQEPWIRWAWDLMEQDMNSVTVATGEHAPNYMKTILGDAWVVNPGDARDDLLDRMYERIRRITSDEILNGRCYL